MQVGSLVVQAGPGPGRLGLLLDQVRLGGLALGLRGLVLRGQALLLGLGGRGRGPVLVGLRAGAVAQGELLGFLLELAPAALCGCPPARRAQTPLSACTRPPSADGPGGAVLVTRTRAPRR